MTRDKVLFWLHVNLVDWPKDSDEHLNIPYGDWMFWSCGHQMESVVINQDTGDFINMADFFDYRYNFRLQPCGRSFKELITDLNEE